MSAPEVIVIGGSAGGMEALRRIFRSFQQPGNTHIFVVLHRPPQASPLVEVLQSCTKMPLREPANSPWACPAGTVTLAPAGYHLLIGNSRRLRPDSCTPLTRYETGCGVRAHLTLDKPVAYSRPSLDVTFSSAAELVNPVTAVLLSCANEDGAVGCEAVQAAGGRVVLQDPASCEAATAVKAAMRRVQPDHVADPEGIGRWLSQTVRRVR
ncbi:MAG: chemotaxis protein CheB [Mycolicibacterium sp.]|uniref:chemotaxis protein CheB n=1 Tax=Mycolicibacterium sp. TaxID=2320850 RepID=UPI003D098651